MYKSSIFANVSFLFLSVLLTVSAVSDSAFAGGTGLGRSGNMGVGGGIPVCFRGAPADCAGVCGGTAVVDCTGVCGGDEDSDGVGDACDNCLHVNNPLQVDSNDDGYGNMCDSDYDQDGVVGQSDDDFISACSGANVKTSPSCLDADSDGDGFVLESDYTVFISSYEIPVTASSLAINTDGDGYIDSKDNCRDFPNPQQEDVNNDGKGDVCDGLDIFQQNIYPIIEQPCITNINQPKVIINQEDAHPVGQYYLVGRHLGAPGTVESTQSVDHPVSYDVGFYTGLYPPSPVENYQRGFYDLGAPSGSTAFQVYCDSVGIMLNSWSFNHDQGVTGGGPQALWSYTHESPKTPWSTPDSALTLQAWVQLPWHATWNGGIGQIGFGFYLRDTVNNVTFPFILSLFDSRPESQGVGGEFLSHDTFTPFVSSALKSGTRYSTLSPYSESFRSVQGWDEQLFYRVHVTQQNLLHAVSDLMENNPGLELSLKPSDYVLTLSFIITELFVETAEKNVSMGMNFQEFMVYESY
jgi:hypothetical protein